MSNGRESEITILFRTYIFFTTQPILFCSTLKLNLLCYFPKVSSSKSKNTNTPTKFTINIQRFSCFPSLSLELKDILPQPTLMGVFKYFLRMHLYAFVKNNYLLY